MRDKLIAGVLVVATLGFFYLQVSSTSRLSGSAGWFAEVSLAEAQELHQTLGGDFGAAPIIVFETSWCSVCKAVRSELDRKKIAYLAVDIEKNMNAQDAYRKLLAGRNGGVPLTLVGSKAVLGYRIAMIMDAYEELRSQLPVS